MGKIAKIKVVGREKGTPAEGARNEFVLLLLQGKISLEDSPFIRRIYFPTREDIEEAKLPPTALETGDRSLLPKDSILNESQARVTCALLTPDSFPAILTQGPPGSGKTRTIAAAVGEWAKDRNYVWLVAQSNVGVKRIAETLIKNEDLDFALIVSKDFYAGWHEHLYGEMRRHIIPTDELKNATEKIRAVSTVLCTIDMLCNPTLMSTGVFDAVPVERLIIDEASQIFAGSYMVTFSPSPRLPPQMPARFMTTFILALVLPLPRDFEESMLVWRS
ncbi:hypothetical protein BOTBODRAFT_114634 [Botryobasidium botryosum FD-172 SS1]|uniref:DNA2/NAM7 helicase helicase domain-containing protein n=1 Tax=Botryobasidium botryosum (strain FD-172 SS1) TaxID=930990 RepID=A0A067M6V8_BOTB1|nr:hypothetical protein BOTBODRAFT_114634 [Botryobasidium botryosum FD-172 SS1]